MPDSETLARLAKELVPVVKHLHSLHPGKLVNTQEIQDYCQREQNKILAAGDVPVAMHIAIVSGLIVSGLYTEYPGDIRSLSKWSDRK